MADSPIFTGLCDVLRRQGWKFTRVDGREVVELAFGGRCGTIPIHAQAFEAIGALGFTAEAMHPTGLDYRAKLAELLMRVNVQMTVGNFEMDWDGPRVYFRVVNLFDGAPPGDRLVAGMVHATVAETDRMMALMRALGECPVAGLAAFDISRLLRREDLFPDEPA